MVTDEGSDFGDPPTNYVMLAWNEYELCTVTSYTVQRRVVNTNNWTTIGTTADTTFMDATIDGGIVYEYRLLINCDNNNQLVACSNEHCTAAAPDGPDDAVLSLSGSDLVLTCTLPQPEGCVAFGDPEHRWTAADPDTIEVSLSLDGGVTWSITDEYSLPPGPPSNPAVFSGTVFANVFAGQWRAKVRAFNHNAGGIAAVGRFGAPSNIVTVP